jgi:hypothetical protein
MLGLDRYLAEAEWCLANYRRAGYAVRLQLGGPQVATRHIVLPIGLCPQSVGPTSLFHVTSNMVGVCGIDDKPFALTYPPTQLKSYEEKRAIANFNVG